MDGNIVSSVGSEDETRRSSKRFGDSDTIDIIVDQEHPPFQDKTSKRFKDTTQL